MILDAQTIHYEDITFEASVTDVQVCSCGCGEFIGEVSSPNGEIVTVHQHGLDWYYEEEEEE